MSLSPGAKAAIGVWASAIVWDLICPEGQTVSEAVERGLNNKKTEPYVTAVIITTTMHLLRSVSPKYDIYSIVFDLLGRLKRKLTKKAS